MKVSIKEVSVHTWCFINIFAYSSVVDHPVFIFDLEVRVSVDPAPGVVVWRVLMVKVNGITVTHAKTEGLTVPGPMELSIWGGTISIVSKAQLKLIFTVVCNVKGKLLLLC